MSPADFFFPNTHHLLIRHCFSVTDHHLIVICSQRIQYFKWLPVLYLWNIAGQTDLGKPKLRITLKMLRYFCVSW